MIDWPTVGPVLIEWFKYGLDDETVVFENQPRPYTYDGNGRWAYVSLDEDKDVGTFLRYADGVPWILGWRELQFSVWAESKDQDFEGWAVNMASRLISYSILPIQHLRLKAVDVALIDAVSSVKQDVEVDEHMHSVRGVTVRFRAAYNHEVGDSAAQGSWIATVGMTSIVKPSATEDDPTDPQEETIGPIPEVP